MELNEREEQRLNDIKLLMGNDGWRYFLLPEIEKRRQEYNLILLDPRPKKSENMNDDFLRGAVLALTWVARLPKQRLMQLTQQPIVHQDEYPELSPTDSDGEV